MGRRHPRIYLLPAARSRAAKCGDLSTVEGHVALVFLQGAGENVPTAVIANKVERAARRRGEGSTDGD